MNLGNLSIGKIAADQNERRCDVVKVEVTQVRYALTAAKHTE